MPYFYWGAIFAAGLLVVAAIKADYNARVFLVVFLIIGMFFFNRKRRR